MLIFIGFIAIYLGLLWVVLGMSPPDPDGLV